MGKQEQVIDLVLESLGMTRETPYDEYCRKIFKGTKNWVDGADELEEKLTAEFKRIMSEQYKPVHFGELLSEFVQVTMDILLDDDSTKMTIDDFTALICKKINEYNENESETDVDEEEFIKWISTSWYQTETVQIKTVGDMIDLESAQLEHLPEWILEFSDCIEKAYSENFSVLEALMYFIECFFQLIGVDGILEMEVKDEDDVCDAFEHIASHAFDFARQNHLVESDEFCNESEENDDVDSIHED